MIRHHKRLAAIALAILAVLFIAACDPELNLTVHSDSGETVTSVVEGSNCEAYELTEGRAEGSMPRSCLNTGGQTISFLLDGEPVQFKVLGQGSILSSSSEGPHDSIVVNVTSDPHKDLIVEIVGLGGSARIGGVADVETEATSAAGAAMAYNPPEADDGAGTALEVVCDTPSGSTFPLGATLVTCTATPETGDPLESTFTVTVVDTTAPELTAPTLTQPADIVVLGISMGKVVSYTLPTVFDAVDLSPDFACSPASGSTFALATTVVTCTATDDAGNSGQTTFNVTVNDLGIPSASPGSGCPATGKGGSFPPFPTFATGTVTVNGAVVADGTMVFTILRHSNPALLFDLTGAEDPVCYGGFATISGGVYTLTVGWPSDDSNWFPAEFYIQLAGELVGFQATTTPDLTRTNYAPAGTVTINLTLTIPD